MGSQSFHHSKVSRQRMPTGGEECLLHYRDRGTSQEEVTLHERRPNPVDQATDSPALYPLHEQIDKP